MSGIYGIYRYDGAPVAPHWLSCMKTAMAYYGPDGGGERIETSLGVGHLLLKVSPEEEHEVQPVLGCRGLTVSASRLDNRQELLELLDVPPPTRTSVSDGQIVGMAFDRWGEESVCHLEGDWALAAWDRRRRTLMLARDAVGNENLYFLNGQGYLAFASRLKALLALPGVTLEPELLRLAGSLVSWQHDPNLTEFKGFRRLPWAHTLKLDSGGSTRVSRYWSPEGREPLNYRRDEDYEEEFLERYSKAVRSCLRSNGPVAGTLSGGRDSGSVTAIAAPLLAGMGRGYTAYTSIPCLPPDGAGKARMGNEWDLAHATAVLTGEHVRHVAIDADQYGVLDGIKHLLDVHDGPSHAANNHYWIKAIADAAVGDGVRVLLTGQMGNGTVSWAGNGSALLALIGGQPRLAWRLLLHAEDNPWLTIKRQFLKPVLTPARRFAKRLKSPARPVWQYYSALNPRMASALELNKRMREAGHDPTFTPSPLRDQRPRFFRPEISVGPCILSELGAMHGFSMRDPTSNLALLEFLLRVPDCQFRRHGQTSYLFRRAFRGRLPQAVLEGRHKGFQAADVGHRILREKPAIEECLDQIDSNARAKELLDVSAMRRSLEDLTAKIDPESTARAAGILLRGVGVGLFLRNFG